MRKNIDREELVRKTKMIFKEHYGIIDDEEKIKEIVQELKKRHVDGMYANGYYCSYFIMFDMKIKVIIDKLFENSRDYMIDTRCVYPNVGVTLDICDLINVYAPTMA